GADGFLSYGVNGITATGADGIIATGTDGITATGADGATYTGTNGITATGADGITITGADGITATGADGITITGADGTVYSADSVLIRQPSGITATGADGITATGADGITATGADGITATGADGITITGADGITITGADGITATGADGQIFSVSPNGITITGADGITATGADGITITGADMITVTGADGITATDGQLIGLQSLDPELAIHLNQLTDDSNVNAIVVYHRLPSESDIADLQNIGVAGGTRYRKLPMISLTATKQQIINISRHDAVRSIYGNRTLQLTMDRSHAMTGVDRVRVDADVASRNGGSALTGRGVNVAVLDTGMDSTHGDLAGRVVRNVKLADAQSASVGFTYPVNIEGLANTDQVSGHGTFVGGVIAGSGARSNGKFKGVAPGAGLVGLSAGDLNLFYVLAGFDYLLERGEALGVRVLNCSFSANTVFDINDPVNVSTKMLFSRGINVVFSAGNTGPGLHTLNPYAVAPWVVSVGATDERGRLADFSARGHFGSILFRPTLVAPGVNIVSLRGAGAPLIAAFGVGTATDGGRISAIQRPYYTAASGTSFSAPQVAGTIALMIEANPALAPAEIRDILQRAATPLPPYYQHEVGAGMMNARAAVLEAAFPQRRMGRWRATLDRQQVRFVNDPTHTFSGIVQPGSTSETAIPIPANALLASAQIAWGPLWSVNDLSLTLHDAGGVRRAESNTINILSLKGKRERTLVKMPAAGSWSVRVANMLGLGITAQAYSGALEVTRAEYPVLTDLGSLSSDARDVIYQNLRSFVMWPYGKRFRPEFGVTRADLAAALVFGGRVPQYLPAQSGYSDVRDKTTMIFVESAQAATGGPLFHDAALGGNFRPDEMTNRLTAAIALVRAAGLRAEAEAQTGVPLTVTDANEIPAQWRGYVSVALSRRILTADGTHFRPQNSLTRAALAHATVSLASLATE
ncbi:MAG: S8 family serine peptidase, partial [Acidobacteriota bacterium]|nr:S8 family serine peptidase [Acidobacteriota bacterium]